MMSLYEKLLGSITGGSTPLANPGEKQPLRQEDGETAFDASALPASGAWRRSAIINVLSARRVAVWRAYTPAAIGGYPLIIPLVAGRAAAPAPDADEWFPLAASDGSVSAAAVTGTLPSGSDFTGSPEFGVVRERSLVLDLQPALATTDRIRLVTVLDVTHARWFQLIAAEKGVTASPGTLGLYVSLST